MRHSAKRREIAFTITFAEFELWAVEYDYLTKRGRGRHGYTVDRRDEDKGYTLDNIQIMTNCRNAAKGNAFYKAKRAALTSRLTAGNSLAEKLRNRKQVFVDAKIMGHNIEKQRRSAK